VSGVLARSFTEAGSLATIVSQAQEIVDSAARSIP